MSLFAGDFVDELVDAHPMLVRASSSAGTVDASTSRPRSETSHYRGCARVAS